MSCSHLDTCPLFKLLRLKPSLGVWAVYYCESGFERCQRLKLLRAGEAVPLTLLPNGKTLSRQPMIGDK